MGALPKASRSTRAGVHAGVAALFVAALFSLATGCTEQRAEKAFADTMERAESMDVDDLRAELAAIDERWPQTAAAAKARRELEWMDDLRQVTARGPALMAWDAVRDVANAVERYRLEEGRYPRSIRDLVPRFLDGPTRDPWGNLVLYERHPAGYRVICYGEDGIPGGAGGASDVLVDTGREVRVGTSGPS